MLRKFYNSFVDTIRNKGYDEKYLLFDEFSSYALSKDTKQFKELMSMVSHIAFMGRSFGYHLIFISQQFNSKVLDTAIREQFGIKMYLGSTISTEWNSKTSISLGMFVFVSVEPFFVKKFAVQISVEELSNRLLVHEYGHTVQLLILGPLYLVLIGIPSTLWGFFMAKKRKEKQIPYGAFITEKWTNSLGKYVTGEKSIGNLVIE